MPDESEEILKVALSEYEWYWVRVVDDYGGPVLAEGNKLNGLESSKKFARRLAGMNWKRYLKIQVLSDKTNEIVFELGTWDLSDKYKPLMDSDDRLLDHFSTRTDNCLKNAGIPATIAILSSMSDNALLAIHGMGRKSVKEIREAIKKVKEA